MTREYGNTGHILPPAPGGTKRVTMVVGGYAYYPLAADCPAAACTKGNSLALGIADPGTEAYLAAVERKIDRDLNIFGAVLTVGGQAIRIVEGVSGLWSATRVGATGGVVTAEGTANAATVQGLKGQLASENLANIAAQDSRLAAAVRGSGKSNPNFSIGTGTAAEANQLGQTWVGDGARLISNQNACPGCLISADGTRIYRPPSLKPNTPAEFNPTGVQANFVQQTSSGQVISNGHLVVKP